MLFKDFIKKIYENKNETLTIIFPMIGVYEFTKIMLYSDDIENIKKHCQDIFPLNAQTINFNKEKMTIEKYEKIMCCLDKVGIINIDLDILYIFKCLVDKNIDVNNVTFKIDKNLYQINSDKYLIYWYDDEFDNFIQDNLTDILKLDECFDKNKLIADNISMFIKNLLNNKSQNNYPNDFVKFVVENKIENIKTHKKEKIFEKITANYKLYKNDIIKKLKSYSIEKLFYLFMIGNEITKYIEMNCLKNKLNKLNAETKQEKLCGEKYKKIIIKEVEQ